MFVGYIYNLVSGDKTTKKSILIHFVFQLSFSALSVPFLVLLLSQFAEYNTFRSDIITTDMMKNTRKITNIHYWTLNSNLLPYYQKYCV